MVNGITIPCRIKGEIKKMARELSQYIKTNTSIDWKLRESVRAKLRIGVKRLLKKYGYPPDKQKMATDLVLEQAEVLSDRWVNKEEDAVKPIHQGKCS